MAALRHSILFATAVLCAACSSMLPRGSTDTPSPFQTFEHAQGAAEKIVPFRTRLADLPALGFDPKQGKNVTLIPYPDIVARLAPYPGVPLENLDPGIRACIVARTDCMAYVFRFERLDRKRAGGFWADFLNIQRVTVTTGWWFETLVVAASDGTVLFRNQSGEAHIDKMERQTNPLGPLQPAGESIGGALLH
ncbi:MAG: hypothetical protein HY854_16445 [Burkholderiales bacterium]|nr:hypothetical protein [Burkholderiales bacterium]